MRITGTWTGERGGLGGGAHWDRSEPGRLRPDLMCCTSCSSMWRISCFRRVR